MRRCLLHLQDLYPGRDVDSSSEDFISLLNHIHKVDTGGIQNRPNSKPLPTYFLPIDILAMPNFQYKYEKNTPLNLINDTVIPNSKAVKVFLGRKSFYASWKRVSS
jgi:hypothetical protein